MDSARPIAPSTAGQSTLSTGINTFAMRTFTKAEKFAFDWLGLGFAHAQSYRESHHPLATGYRHV